jgi:hypothetical protein
MRHLHLPTGMTSRTYWWISRSSEATLIRDTA